MHLVTRETLQEVVVENNSTKVIINDANHLFLQSFAGVLLLPSKKFSVIVTSLHASSLSAIRVNYNHNCLYKVQKIVLQT